MAKMPRQIQVANQYVNQIRPASFEAAVGIQGIKRATAAPIPKAARVSSSSWRSEPRRTEREPYSIVTKRSPRTDFAPFPVVSKITFAGIPVERKEANRMGIGVSLILIAVGAILTWAVNASVSGVDINAIGVILMIVGAVGLLLSLIFWGSWGGYGARGGRRVTTYDDAPPP